jgi:aromatic ring-opening dioxygenase LigB subunit
MIVAAAIAPHGMPALEPSPTRDALEEVGRRFQRAGPEAIVVVTPHNVHVDGHFAVVTAGKVAGDLSDWDVDLRLERLVDRRLASALEGAVGVSYGGNDPGEAVMPLDWGALIPLAFLPELPVVIVSPARDRPLTDHLRLGEAIARLPARIGLVASADHGHAHDPEGPYGYDPASAEYDELVVAAVQESRLGDLLELEELANRAKADSLWQLVVLHGAVGDGWRAELLSYEAPTYFGMLVAIFEPVR